MKPSCKFMRPCCPVCGSLSNREGGSYGDLVPSGLHNYPVCLECGYDSKGPCMTLTQVNVIREDIGLGLVKELEKPMEMFRRLDIKEEAEFRLWARDHKPELIEAERTGRISIFHPIIRAEWGKMCEAETRRLNELAWCYERIKKLEDYIESLGPEALKLEKGD